MIKLCVEDYCQDCTEFEPDVQKVTLFGGKRDIADTTIFCEHRERCEHIKEFLSEGVCGK